MVNIELSLHETRIYVSALHWVIFGHSVKTARPTFPVMDYQLITLHSRIIESWPKLADDLPVHGAEAWAAYEKKRTMRVECGDDELTAIILCLKAVLIELDADPIEMEVVINGDATAVANVRDRLLQIQRDHEGTLKLE